MPFQLKVRLPFQLNVRLPFQLKVRVEVEVLAMGGSFASGGCDVMSRLRVGSPTGRPRRGLDHQGDQVPRRLPISPPAREPVDQEAISRVPVGGRPGKGTLNLLTSALRRIDQLLTLPSTSRLYSLSALLRGLSVTLVIPAMSESRVARHTPELEEFTMSKRARKRRARKSNAANHGRKPNA